MPTLDWIGKRAVLNYHNEVPYRQLLPDEAFGAGDRGSGNLLIEGDNLEALRSLLPQYEGQVKLIYIDPPYNTGKEAWIYNDNVNSPEIKSWLAKVVGNENEDLSRHDKWLCMMYPRLKLAHRLLSKDGIMIISIDDNEDHNLRILMDEVFDGFNTSKKPFLAKMSWITEGNSDNQAKIKKVHEYIYVYAKDHRNFERPNLLDPGVDEDSKLNNSVIRNTIVKNGPKNPASPIVIPAGFPCSFERGTISSREDKWPHIDVDIVVENFVTKNAFTAYSGWSSSNILKRFIESRFLPVHDTKGQNTVFELNENGTLESIKEREEDKSSHVTTLLRFLGGPQLASAELKEAGLNFDYAKPIKLIKYLLGLQKDKNALVLDFFAGSGTTGAAVLEKNAEDSGNRQFILVQMADEGTPEEPKPIARPITARRLTYAVEQHGSGFEFLTLGETLFEADGRIREGVSYEALARYVFHYATGEAWSGQQDGPFLGRASNGLGIYLLYNGVLKDKHPHSGNVLTRDIYVSLPPTQPGDIIFGTASRLSPGRLDQLGITFEQIPYALKGGK